MGFYFSVYFLDFVSTENIYQTLETGFHRLSKHLEFLRVLILQFSKQSRENTAHHPWPKLRKGENNYR